MDVMSILQASSRFCEREAPLAPEYRELDSLPIRDGILESSIHHIASTLSEGRPVGDLQYLGPMGTGKTLCAERLIAMSREAIEQTGVPVIVLDRIEVSAANTNATYFAILKQLDETQKGKGNSGREDKTLLHDIARAAKERGAKTLFVCLDEFHAHKNPNQVIYDLTRMGTNYGVNVQLLLVSNNDRWLEQLDGKASSSYFQQDAIEFDAYESDELIAILEHRLELAGFKQELIEQGVIPLCSTIGAKHGGDAREMLRTFYKAYQAAKKSGADKVTEDHVRLGQAQAHQDRTKELTRKLNPLNKTLIFAMHVLNLRGMDRSPASDVYSQYEVLADRLGLEKVTVEYITQPLKALVETGFIKTTERNRGRAGGRVYYYELTENVRKIVPDLWAQTYPDKELAKVPHGTLPSGRGSRQLI